MAKKFKKFFALVVAASMLTSMLPLQALADENETTVDFASLQVVDGLDVNMTIEGDKIVVEFAPTDEPTGDEPTGDEPTGDEPTGDEPTGDEPTGDDPTGDDDGATVVENPEGSVEWETGLTLGDGITPEVEDITVTEKVEHEGDPVTDPEDDNAETEGEDAEGENVPADAEDTSSETGAADTEGEDVVIDEEETSTETEEPETEGEATEGEGTAEEGEDAAEDEESDGTTTSTTTTTITESVTVGTEGTLENGAVIEGEENYTETTTTTVTTTTTTTETETSIDTVTETTTTETIEGVVEGKETITEETLGTLTDVTVDVPLTEDDPETEEQENVNTVLGAEEETVLETEGEKPEQIGEGEYDYSETVVQEQGSVTITTTEVEFSETIDTENTDLEHVVSTTTPTDTNDLVYVGQASDMYLPGYEGTVTAPEGSADDEYGYVYVGSGNTSKLVPAIVFTEPLDEAGKLAQYGENAYIKKNSITWYYEKWLTEDVKATIAKDENGDYVTDENGYILDVNGNRIFKEERTSVDPDGNTVYLHRFDNYNNSLNVEGWYEDGEWVEELNGDKAFTGIWAGPQQFILVDDKGNTVTTYCADFSTPTQDFYGYNVENLEDATYYSDEEAEHIRAIAENGYWGDEGNLEEMRQKLLDAGFTAEEVASLNDGVALSATQMAIWSYSNKMSSLEFINAHYSNWGPGNVPAEKEDEVKLLFKLYDYLTTLEPVKPEGTTADTIINKDNFVDEVSVTVIEKVVDHENNQDDNEDNDTYKTNVSFALVVKPSTENGDDLIVQVVAADGTVLASGRVAGELKDGETQLDPDEEGNYTFKDIEMTEGEQNFKLTLEGIQHLKEGVYLYSSEIRQVENGNGSVDEESSQTLVGVASGDRAVSVEMNIKFDLDVKDEVVVTERVWRDEMDPVVSETKVRVEKHVEKEIPQEEEEEEEDAPVPVVYRMTRGVGQLETIIDEEVPLAEVPQTGDNSILWFALIMLSVCGLWILHMSDKKCKA